MHLKSEWFFGETGSSRLRALSESLREQWRINLNREFNLDFTHFEPWMSCKSKHSYFVANRLSRLQHHNKCRTLHADLQTLDRGFYESESQPFGLLHAAFDSFRIASGSSDVPVKYVEEIERAFAIISAASPELFELSKCLISEFIPITKNRNPLREMGAGMSAHWFIGGVFLSLPKKFEYSSVELAINIVHELGHQSLIVYQNADRIVAGDMNSEVYSPVRKQARPVLLALHAVIAIAFMVEFLRALQRQMLPKKNAYCESRLSQLERDYALGIEAFRDIPMTDFGRSLVADLEKHLRAS